ncbi:hypothetical protein JJC02_10575 [Clostridioides sp. ES-S-0054-01]|nr:hypothetical protein JJC02_10575 [Clostridioides sp. ES-S-0054-01]
MGKYQDQLLQLENKLETGLYCELVDKELKDSYIEYTLLYDTIASRIQIDEATAVILILSFSLTTMAVASSIM